jgi:hypothetical protein
VELVVEVLVLVEYSVMKRDVDVLPARPHRAEDCRPPWPRETAT